MCRNWGVTHRMHVPAPSHRQQRALLTPCSLVPISPMRKPKAAATTPRTSPSAQTPLCWLVSVNQFPGSALCIIFPNSPEAMFYLYNLSLKKFLKVPFEIIWSGGKPNLVFFLSSLFSPPLSKIPVLPASSWQCPGYLSYSLPRHECS